MRTKSFFMLKISPKISPPPHPAPPPPFKSLQGGAGPLREPLPPHPFPAPPHSWSACLLRRWPLSVPCSAAA